jgi:hypothetical protein
MTWYFDPSGTTMDVYDHTGAIVREGYEFGGGWTGTPDIVYEIMADEARKAVGNGNIAYAAEVFADGIADNIEQGTPPA